MNFLDEIKNLKEQIKSKDKFDINFNFDNIVISGMGGSGIVGNIFQEYYTSIPVISIGDYGIPGFVMWDFHYGIWCYDKWNTAGYQEESPGNCYCWQEKDIRYSG